MKIDMTAQSPPVRPGLKGRVVRAGKWTLFSTAVAMVLRLGTNVILARLLFPDAFGLMAVVNLMVTAMGLFSDIGISRSVVQSRRGDDGNLLDTAWTVQAIRGMGLGLGCIAMAGADALAIHLGLFKAGTVYADPRLPWIMIVFAIAPMIQGFDSIRIVQSLRQMNLHHVTKIELSGQLASALVMVVVAFTTRSVWTLVCGAITAAVVRSILGHTTLLGHRARLRIDRDALAEILMAGKWIFLSSILFFLALNSDKVLLAGMIDKRVFGIYSIALLMANVLQGIAAKLCQSIAYPALAEVFRERPHDLAKMLAKFQWAYDGSIVFLASTLIVAGPAFIAMFYDHRYREAGWMLSLLAVGVIGGRYQIVEECYQAVGQPKYATLANLIRLCTLVGGIMIGMHFYGFPGAVFAVAVCQFSAWPIAIWFKIKRHAFSWRAEAVMLPAIAAGLVAGWAFTRIVEWALPQRFVG